MPTGPTVALDSYCSADALAHLYYIDDLLQTGNASFRQISRMTNKRFEIAKEHQLPCEIMAFVIDRDRDGVFCIDQNEYLRRLECLPPDASYSHFRSVRMRLAWLANSQPDCMFEISQVAQVTEEMFAAKKTELVRRLNKAVKDAVDSRVKLKISKLDVSSLKFIGFSDAPIANNYDLSSQLGHVVFLGDVNGDVVPISFKSYKARRVTRSAVSGEVIAYRQQKPV